MATQRQIITNRTQTTMQTTTRQQPSISSSQSKTTTQTTADATTGTQTITKTTSEEQPGTTTTQTTTTETTEQPLCTPPAPEASQPIITTILADVAAIVPQFSSLVSSYRLLVGAAEEIHRTPGVCPDVFERAVRRYDNTGTIIDMLIELLCCKIAYSSEFLSVTCAPVDIFRLIANRCDPCDQSHRTAEQIITLEALRRALSCNNTSCFPYKPVVCPQPPSPPAQPAAPAAKAAATATTTARTAATADVKPMASNINCTCNENEEQEIGVIKGLETAASEEPKTENSVCTAPAAPANAVPASHAASPQEKPISKPEQAKIPSPACSNNNNIDTEIKSRVRRRHI